MGIPSNRYSIVTSIFAAVAFLLGLEAAISCTFISFHSNSGFSEPVTMRFGIWTWESWTFVTSTGGSTVVYETCSHYPSDEKIDSNWKAARAFSTVALVVGGVFLFSNLILSCISSSQNKLRFEGLCFMLTSIFQGLSLLLLGSVLCNDNDLVIKLSEEINLRDFGMETTCSMHSGANCAITAVVFWFLAGLTSRMASLSEKSEVEKDTTKEPLISEENL